jgi:hypothetical protein
MHARRIPGRLGDPDTVLRHHLLWALEYLAEMGGRRFPVEFAPPDTKIARMTSSNDVRNDSSALVTMAKRIWGSVTSRNARGREAPRLRATISWLMS